MKSYSEHKIGQNKGAPRIWIEGRQPRTAGFMPGARFTVELRKERKAIFLKLINTGERVVSGKTKGGEMIPIIDLNSVELLTMFAGMERIRVIARDGELVILPLASEARKEERLTRIKDKLERAEPLKVGSISHGGGVLSLAVHEGLNQEGVSSRLAFANDIRGDLLEHAAEHNPAWDDATIAVAAPMQEVAFDFWAMENLPAVDVLEAGIPCEAASLSGRAKNGTPMAEAHEHCGHLVVAFLAIVAKLNPAVVLLENVPPYQATASMWQLRNQLRDLKYNVHEVILDGAEWNTLEHRKRLCMVAVTEGIEFSWADLLRPTLKASRLGEVLEDIPLDAACWSEMGYLKDKAVRDAEQGKGFAMQIVTPDSTKVGTIGKGYQKNRSTEPKVQHPEKPNLLRLLTPKEHAAVKGIPHDLIEGLPATTAHELLGQAVLFQPFKAVAGLIASALKSWANHVSVDSEPLQLKFA